MSKKNELGQFFTNETIAGYMAKLVYSPSCNKVLDPAVGPGVLLKSIKKICNRNLEYTGYDVDADMLSLFQENSNIKATLIHTDYLTDFFDEKYDAIICNPPYNKFQEIPLRDQYIKTFAEKYNIKISGYSNLCVYFLIKSLNELLPNGKCVYIIPYEFLNTGYGKTIKQYLLNSKMLKAIIKFDNNLSLFSDAITTSCIILFENNHNETVDFISISSIKEIEDNNPNAIVSRNYNDLDPTIKWNNYFNSDEDNAYNNLVPFSNVAKVKRGIATGNNTFFSLSQPQIKKLKLSSKSCIKCIAKSPDIRVSVFTESDFEITRKADKKVFLFDGQRASTDSDFAYIRYGEENEVNKSYLNSHRNPWYLIENKDVAPIWISVFNRDKLKIIRNETSCKNLTTFHGVYLNDDCAENINIFFCYLLTPICQTILKKNKREYGDGLDKFEPNDLNNSSVLDISVISHPDKEKILIEYEKIKSTGVNDSIISLLNSIFSSYILNKKD